MVKKVFLKYEQQGGANGRGKRRQMQARGMGRRDERRRLAGGGRGQRPCGQQPAQVEDMGSGCTYRCYDKV